MSALRRRRKPSLATRLKIFWVFIVASIAAASYAGYVLVTLPQLRVHTISVAIDGAAVTKDDVLAAARIDRHKNVWLLDSAAMAQRIEAIPYVDRVEIRRTLPAQIAIAITEREPVACVRLAARLVSIDRDRRILQNGCARPRAVRIDLRQGVLGLPGSYATSPDLVGLLADGRTLSEAQVGVRSIGQDGFGQLIAVENSGVRLLFGNDGDLAEKAKLVGPVLSAARPGHIVRAVDLRAPATPTVEFR